MQDPATTISITAGYTDDPCDQLPPVLDDGSTRNCYRITVRATEQMTGDDHDRPCPLNRDRRH